MNFFKCCLIFQHLERNCYGARIPPTPEQFFFDRLHWEIIEKNLGYLVNMCVKIATL